MATTQSDARGKRRTEGREDGAEEERDETRGAVNNGQKGRTSQSGSSGSGQRASDRASSNGSRPRRNDRQGDGDDGHDDRGDRDDGDRDDRDDRAGRDDREDRGDRGGRSTGRSRIGLPQAMRLAAGQLAELLRREPASVSAVKATEDGWTAEVEVVEVERIPETTSVMASYRVELDEEGNISGYERIRRYAAGQIDQRR